ncbi:unnamed protein product [Pseudo-nitzschia multistriata]|uniref:Metallo-beta-lactamase domain-containing protein n=1 Tax=Pseudo-nitzschia multistriata TaxID=183589 RepID=A0A448ZI44_9STRA|nr:unnamed protein product [Pseudo-nitzschia multistriata]
MMRSLILNGRMNGFLFLVTGCLILCLHDGIDWSDFAPDRSAQISEWTHRPSPIYYHFAAEAFVPFFFNFHSIVERRNNACQQRILTATTTGNRDILRPEGSIATRNARSCPPTSCCTSSSSFLTANAPRRFTENAYGPLYVNDRCINCAACSMFAPSVFSRESKTEGHHIVSKQPVTEKEIEESRAALAACPVAAIRVDKKQEEHAASAEENSSAPSGSVASQLAINPKFNGRPLPFPKLISPNLSDVFFVGHHNSKSFGAAPYLLSSLSNTEPTWIMVDTPRYSESAVRAVESLTGSIGPSYLVLTHVDDTADHNSWKDKYPNLKRIFHAGDLGTHNWIGDETLEDVEILLTARSSDRSLQYFDLKGNPIDNETDGSNHDVVLVHTPGHSPGSIALLKRASPSINGSESTKNAHGVLFSGDTYSYTTREGGHMSGFPLYGNDARLQSKILPLLLDLDWNILAPGHGHVRDYTLIQESQQQQQLQGTKVFIDSREKEMEAAIEELSRYL